MHAESSKRWWRILTILIPILAVTGCGEGDGPIRILGTAATPLPPGFVAPAPTLGVFSETNDDQVVIIQDIQQAGNTVLISTERVRVFEGEVSLGLTYTTGGELFGGATILFEDADVSPYNTLKFAIDTSTFANFATLTVQLEPPQGGTVGANVSLSDYTPVATSGAWETYEIPLAAFPSVNLTLVNKLGFFNARDGSDTRLAGTLYLDDIHFTVTDFGGSGGAAGTPIDPEVVLYATEGDPDLTTPDDYDDVTGLGSGSVANLNYADDDTYSKVLSVFSGIINDTNVAQVGFIGFDPGFVTFYEDLIFKIKGVPNFVVFVTLYDDGDPVRINLTSSDYSEALGNGWYQVSIPLSSFTGLTTATGIVFESDDSAQMQFNMFLTDIGFSGTADDGGDGGDTGGGDIVLATFDEATPPAITEFGGAIATIAAGPAGGDGNALKIDRNNGGPNGLVFAGAWVAIPPIPSDAGDQTVSARVYSPTAGVRMVAKAEYGDQLGSGDTEANEAVVVGWQTLTWTFTNLDPNESYNRFVLLPNLGNVDDLDYYFDDITVVGTGGGGDTGGGDTVLATFDEATPPAITEFGGAIATIAAGPAGGDGNALKIDRNNGGPNGLVFAGAWVAIPPIPSDAGDQTVSARVYSPTAGVRMVAKAEYGDQLGSGDTEANEAVVVGWQTLTWTFTNLDPNESYNRFVLLPNLGNVDDLDYYFDDITVVGTGGGNGGGGVAGDITINGGFETGAFNDGSENASWQQFFPAGSSTQAITTDNPHSGTYAANLNIPVLGAGDAPVDNLIKNANLEAGNLTPGASVTVTFWMRGTLVGAGGVVFAELFSELDGGGTSKAEILSGGPIFPNEAWTEYSYDTTLGPDVAGGVTLQLKVGCGPEGCGADVYFDDVSVVIN